LSFVVAGKPEPQGSTKSFGYIPKDKATGAQRMQRTKTGKLVPVILTATTSDNPKNSDWRRTVGFAARAALSDLNLIRAAEGKARIMQPIEGPVQLTVRFYLPRPKYLKARETPHVTRPDASKLLRSLEDAMTGIVYRDDGQIVELTVWKGFAALGTSARAEITVSAL
jgi:Holliday junction resolvase RusA-like endonuclease